MSIPNDIIFEILSRVPAKSLMRMRWACKYWFDLITKDDDFIKLHLQYLCSSTSTVSVLFHNRYFKSGQFYLNRNCLSTQVRISHPFEEFGSGFVCLDSCNGLLLCNSDDQKKLCIWNPCTQEYRLLPDPPLVKSPVHGFDPPLPEIYSNSIYGFSYDRTLDDYEVIRNKDSLQVYTLRTNSWRNIGINPIGNSYSSWKYVNGCLYWIVNSVQKIICFDIRKDKYQEESIQQFLRDDAIRIDLQVLEESLCFVQYFSGHEYKDFFVQIWVMKDNSTANESSTRTSWTQLCKTPISVGRYYTRIELPIRFSGSDEILLLKNRREFDLYDPRSNTTMTLNGIFREIEDVFVNLYDPRSNTTMTLNGIFRELEDVFVKQVYIESLVSLNSATYVKQD